MAFPGTSYAPPGVYTETRFENPVGVALNSLKIPLFIGEGNEFLFQRDLELVRGSSATVDQRVVDEDETGRAVVSVSDAGVVTRGAWDGVLRTLQVRHSPIVTGDGSGTTTTDRSDVSVTIDGLPIVVLSVTGSTGLVELATAPKVGQEVRCTYFFNRTDTLVTDDVSDQVSDDAATIRAASGIGDENAQNPDDTPATLNFYNATLDAEGNVVVPANNVLIVTVDGVELTLTIPARDDYTMAQVATAITAQGGNTSLLASSFINQFGRSALALTADQNLSIGAGSANALLGLVSGDTDSRTLTFYTHNGPIVDGTNGGVTTTDPSHVTVRVNGVQVIPTSVDGATRAVVLANSPAVGATVSITYYFNTWQDTWDYLGHVNVTNVTQCGDVPGSSSYIEDADFVLQDDKIVWGTATLIESGTHTDGATYFGESQVTATLIDNRTFMAECSAVVDSSTGTPVSSQSNFALPFQPTLGNGRSTTIGQSLFQTISNGRIDLPVNRPDVITAYWGFGINDALERGPVDVTKVDGLVITLDAVVPVGANVYATQYYNILTDKTFTLTSVVEGASGVGTYFIEDEGETDIYGATFDTGDKGAGLTGITVEFPSGSELTPDLRFEAVDDTDYVGPVEEIVTVTFAARDASPARMTVPGYGAYEFVRDQSDRANVYIDGSALAFAGYGDAGFDLSAPLAFGGLTGMFAWFLGGEVVYDNQTLGTFSLTSAEELTLTVDGVNIDVPIPTTMRSLVGSDGGSEVTQLTYLINEAASGHGGLLSAPSAIDTELYLEAGMASLEDNYYVGWTVVIGDSSANAPGDFRTVLSYTASTRRLVLTAGLSGLPQLGDGYYIYNPDTMAEMKTATRFNGAVTITAGGHDQLSLVYVGDNTNSSGVINITLSPTTYATADDLATEVQNRFDAAIALLTAAQDLDGLRILCVADADGRLVFTVQLAGDDTAGYIMFASQVAVATDFAILAGLDAATAVDGSGGQAALCQAPICGAYSDPGAASIYGYDRLYFRNRLLPGQGGGMAAFDVEAQTGVEITGGNVLTRAGLSVGDTGEAGVGAVVQPASIVGRVGFTGGMDTDSEPVVTFYSASPAGSVGAETDNNLFDFVLGGVPLQVTFVGSPTGVETPLGPASDATTILGQIIAAMAAVPGATFGTAANIRDTLQLVRQEGAGVRITSARNDTRSTIEIGSGSANSVLGFSDNEVRTRIKPTARQTASAFMGDRSDSGAGSWANLLHDLTYTSAGHFGTEALAGVKVDSAGREYLYFQSMTLGTASSLQWNRAMVGGVQTRDTLFYSTGINVTPGMAAAGEAAVDGFYVVSNKANGSGSADDSVLNNGTGQDGVVGQTYRDQVTGLTFTILPRGWHDNQSGPWLAYPKTNATLLFRCSKTFFCDANIPHNALGGVELLVSNTVGVTAGDTSIVSTHERGGQEPAIGDLYYASYDYQKLDYTTAFYTKLSNIEGAYGAVHPDNPVSLASYLAMLNGAVLVGIKQVPRATGETQASLTTYRNAIDELEGVLPGQALPDIVTPLRTDSTTLYQYLARSNDKMSSIRYKSERTSILGVSAGTEPLGIQNLVQTLSNQRMRVVYPDMVTLAVQDAAGRTKEFLVDGGYVASGLVGSIVSPNVDVATPWTSRRLVGFTTLARNLDPVEQNQVAVKGVTVLENRPPFLRVRHGLTTDMTNVLTKTPTVIMIADEVQRQARVVLESFVGIKFIPGILSQVEGRLSMMLKALVAQQIIAAYTGVSAITSADDPTVAEVEAYYQPIFPLLYLVLTFHLRSSL